MTAAATIRTFEGMTRTSSPLAPPALSLDISLDDLAPARPTPVAVRTVAAVKVYGSGGTEVVALDDVSIDLPAGRFTAVMGPSGSGKSTLMHCVAGLDRLTSGQVFLSTNDGGDVELGRLGDRALTKLRRERIGFVFQSFNLLPTLDVAENITLPMDLAGRRIDEDWVAHVISVVGLGDRLSHRPSELSGGQQQRVAVARALARKPSVIFADEPTGNLDSRSGGEILAFMRSAVDDLGGTIVMVTHDPAAAAHTDEVVFLADGRVVDRLAQPTSATVLDRVKSFGS